MTGRRLGAVVLALAVVTVLHAAAPTIDGISPNTGTSAGGTDVTITGTALNTVTGVTFDGAAATILAAAPDGTAMLVRTPAHAAGQVNVVVTNPDGSATAVNGFTYVTTDGPAPTVTGVTPNKGSTVGGTSITITGTDFRANATVRVGSTDATNVSVVNSETITAVTPARPGGIAGAVPVTVTNSDSTSGVLPNAFTYGATCDADITDNCISVLQINGGAAPADIAVELSGGGTNLQIAIVNNANPDRFELTPAVTTADLITLVLKIAPGFNPLVAVSTGDIQSQGFAWNAGTREATLNLRPRTSSWSQTPGCQLPPGTCAPRASVDYSAFARAVVDQLTGAPADFAANAQGLFLSTNAQTFSTPQYSAATGAFSFQVGAPSKKAADTNPGDDDDDGDSDPDGDPNDNGFFNFFMPVTFINNVWGIADPATLVSNPAQLKVTVGGAQITPAIVPVAAAPGSPAGVKISFEGFHYSVETIAVIVAPTVTGISPTSGPVAGGTPITITGLNFRAGAAVTVGGAAATGVTVVNGTTITAVAPAHAAGAIDVVVTNTDGTTGTLAGAFTYLPPGVQRPDFNNDGKMDIVWQNRTEGYIAAWIMNGLTMTSSDLFSPAVISDPNWRIAAVADMDGDGRTDIVWQEETAGWIAIWKLNGLSLVSSTNTSIVRVPDTDWKIVAAQDFNDDGKTDLLWQHQSQGYLAAWYMDNTTVLDSVLLSPIGAGDTGWKVEGAADLNADGKPDLLWRHQTFGWLAVWLMDGVTMTSSDLLSPNRVADTNWRIAAVGDINADNKPDILWQETTGGWLAAWLMNGTTLGQSVALTPQRVPQLNWRIVGPK